MIQINNVYFTYPNGNRALNGITIEIDRGEFVGLIGKNGAGKTTLAKLINGLLKPEKGYILVDGIDTRETTVAELAKHVGYVFQNPDRFLFSESVEKEIEFTLKNLGFEDDELRNRLEETLIEFDLVKYRKRSPFFLSGGEKKKVALASVLCTKPKYLILDEPTVGQDRIEKTRIINLIEKLRKENVAIIIITHDIEFVAEYIPRVVVMADGMVVADGPTKKVLNNLDILSLSNLTPPLLGSLFIELKKNSIPVKEFITLNDAINQIKRTIFRGLQ
ncbi:MAG: ABC transporter ATP-binding protein [Candidatus Odinarchaeota archaeon]|nr:ABC transporter ATP-binding protein [Candidatus Odinarchaeota archaeon]